MYIFMAGKTRQKEYEETNHRVPIFSKEQTKSGSGLSTYRSTLEITPQTSHLPFLYQSPIRFCLMYDLMFSTNELLEALKVNRCEPVYKMQLQ